MKAGTIFRYCGLENLKARVVIRHDHKDYDIKQPYTRRDGTIVFRTKDEE